MADMVNPPLESPQDPEALVRPRLFTLGSADAFNNAGRANSCFWVEDAQGAYLLDCGPTTPLQLKRLTFDPPLRPQALDVIYLTHLHGDHIGGLPVLLLEINFYHQRRRPLVISGPPTTEVRIRALCEASYPEIFERLLSYPVIFEEHGLEASVEVAGRRVTTCPAAHDPLAYPTSIRIEDSTGCALTFSGDTGWNEDLVNLSAHADAFVIECSYREAVFPGHLSLAEIAEVRSRLTPKRLILTHLGSEARAEALRRQSELYYEVADDGSSWYLD